MTVYTVILVTAFEADSPEDAAEQFRTYVNSTKRLAVLVQSEDISVEVET